MAASGGTHNANAFHVDTPLVGAGTDHPDRARRVFKHPWMFIPAGPETVLQNEAGHAVLSKPYGKVFAFMCGEAAVPATRTNDHRRTRCFPLCRTKNGKGGDVFL